MSSVRSYVLSGHSTSPTTTASVCHFLRLSPELRNKIYDLVLLKSSGEINVWDERKTFTPSLLQTCRRIRFEASGIYFGNHTFYLYMPMHQCAEADSEAIMILSWLSATPLPFLKMIPDFWVDLDYITEEPVTAAWRLILRFIKHNGLEVERWFPLFIGVEDDPEGATSAGYLRKVVVEEELEVMPRAEFLAFRAATTKRIAILRRRYLYVGPLAECRNDRRRVDEVGDRVAGALGARSDRFAVVAAVGLLIWVVAWAIAEGVARMD